jgi:uncharacterized protein (TIGR02001 family)
MKTMKKLLPVAIALSAVTAPAVAVADDMGMEFSANITATSNYVWRGLSQSGNDAAIQGGVDMETEAGIYAGAWLSSLGGGEPSSENDFYLGWASDLGDSGLGLDVGYVYYAYFDNPDETDFGEIYVNLSFDILSAGAAYVTNTGNDNDGEAYDEGDIYFWVGANFDLGNDWSVGGTVGYTAFENDGDTGWVNNSGSVVELSNYYNAQIDLTRSAGDFGDVTLSVSYADEEMQNDDDDIITFISWNKGF